MREAHNMQVPRQWEGIPAQAPALGKPTGHHNMGAEVAAAAAAAEQLTLVKSQHGGVLQYIGGQQQQQLRAAESS